MPNSSKWPLRVAAGMLVLALLPMPYGYYTLLRVVTSATAVYALVSAHRAEESAWVWLWAVVAVMFNPFKPLALGRGVWALVDIATAVLFAAWIRRSLSATDR